MCVINASNMASISTIIKNRIILRMSARIVPEGLFFILPTIVIDRREKINHEEVQTGFDIRLVIFFFSLGIGYTKLKVESNEDVIL